MLECFSLLLLEVLESPCVRGIWISNKIISLHKVPPWAVLNHIERAGLCKCWTPNTQPPFPYEWNFCQSDYISHFRGAFLHNIGGLWGPCRGLDLHVTKTLDRFIKQIRASIKFSKHTKIMKHLTFFLPCKTFSKHFYTNLSLLKTHHTRQGLAL